MKILVTAVLLLVTHFSTCQHKPILDEPGVDKRIELLSIVFRLAGNSEYSSENFKLYTSRIEEYYAPYEDHALIEFAQELREKHGVGYDAVMSMAIHLDDSLNPKVAFTETVPDERWGKENALKFAGLLKRFYSETDSERFFTENQKLYKEISNRFLPVYEHLDLGWYKKFYGKEPNEKFGIVIAPGNGGGNYGRSVDLPNGEREVYAIMGTWKTDTTGMAAYTLESHFPTLLHEFNHSFVNYLLNNDPAPFRKNGEIIYETVKEKMRRGGYGNWQTVLNEALVRAAVIQYMKDHGYAEEEIQKEITEQLNRGFIWIRELVTELEKYDRQRQKYPTLESYYPQLAKAYDHWAGNIDSWAEAADREKARFQSLGEFRNGDTAVDPALASISIHFDKPFAGADFIRPGEDGKEFPDFRNMEYSEDRKTVILDWVLKEDTEYQFILIGLSPQTSAESPNQDVEINFKTK
ncbi:protein of unknown function [Salinimicrobium catena]|uniref:DUF4932 domain-containing protein n=1 Tax=Salinimicrobium catena TaxID=390640 RepID=A0A1H5P7X0_9FLAO|nr:DUF4932 domain-containing protein [Salinimicrobium catena]SDL71781.1 protein of unknown function [Salinimicrobium catena]SEF09111.1 protein of unknown function [Salinimicrobium catena]